MGPLQFSKSKKAEDWWEATMRRMNAYIEAISEILQVPPFAKVKKNKQGGLIIEHLCSSPAQHEHCITLLFKRYHQKIKAINVKLSQSVNEEQAEQLKRDKIEEIARLFQALELLHPFYDGQEATDIVLQSKLLSEEGLNPAILGEPSIAKISLLSEWTQYLAEGIERWKIEALKDNKIEDDNYLVCAASMSPLLPWVQDDLAKEGKSWVFYQTET
ncbi:MAG: hypothetical protein KGZ39_06570 [Simkania sp.]|nr:hypothetical protein [Simkania sp.]